MADLLDEKRSEIDARLQELVDEFQRLDAAAQALDGITATPAPSTKARRGNGHAKASAKLKQATPGTGKRGRPKGTGRRDKEALDIVTANPGFTIAQIAEKMGIRPNYLHRVMPALVDKGLVVKDDKGYWPAQQEEVVPEVAPEPETVNA